MGFEPVPIISQGHPSSPLQETVNVDTQEKEKGNGMLIYLLLAIPAYYLLTN